MVTFLAVEQSVNDICLLSSVMSRVQPDPVTCMVENLERIVAVKSLAVI